jgi:hypothetical protein
MGPRVGQRKETGPQKPCPGPNGVLSPASPPGFVTALTTARSRDAPAECFDERLPRRLPYLRESWRSYSLYPARPKVPIELAGRLPQMYPFPGQPPHPLRNDPLTLTAARRKRNSEALWEVQAYYARQGEHGDHDRLVDEVYEQRVPSQRQERSSNNRRLVRQA